MVLATGLLVLIVSGVPEPSLAQDQETEPETGMTAGWEDGSFFLESEDGKFLLNIGGRLQPRYQYQTRIGEEDISSFFLRRIRVNLRGHLFDERITFRIMPEMSEFANLRDGWIDYSLSRMLNVKAGQFTVPFQRHRYISGNRQLFAERSAPSVIFGFPNGYDIGVGLHGRNSANTFSYGAGVFDGSGRNVRLSDSPGNMVSARLTWAPIGELPRDETDYDYSDRVQLTLGTGVQVATLNEVRDWDLGRSPTGQTRADWFSTTGDIMLRWKGFSIAADGYIRSVEPEDPEVASYSGWAGLINAGYFIVRERLELIARYSEFMLDHRDQETLRRDWEAGINIYQRAHYLKTQINYVNRELASGIEHVFLVQWHLMF